MKRVLDQFAARIDKPYKRLEEWKKASNKRIIGCIPMYFPEELVHAAGAWPVVIQESPEPITTADQYIYPFSCSFVRSVTDSALKGELDFLDGMIFPDTCLQARVTANVLKSHLSFPFFELVQFPQDLGRARANPQETVERLKKLRDKLQEFVGEEIAEQSLRRSIALYNESHALLRRLFNLRRTKPGVLPGKDMLAVVVSSMLMPKEEHNELLKALLSNIEGEEPPADRRVRLLISGHLCHAPRKEILDLIEETGGVVVEDDLYTGYRYFAMDTEMEKDPLEALAWRYLNMTPPCPTRCDPEKDWGEYLVTRVKESRAQGVIILLVMHCEPHMFYYPHVTRILEGAGIPHLLIETEHDVMPLQAIKTRLQAFIERIEGVG